MRPWIWYASLVAKPRCKYLPFRANSKINYKGGNWHSSPPLRRETAAATASDRPDYRIQDIQGFLGCWSELVFLPPIRRGLRGHPYKELQGKRRRQWGGSAFSVRVAKYCNKLPASVVTAPSVKIFKKRLEKFWTDAFPVLPHWLNSQLSPPPPQLHATH